MNFAAYCQLDAVNWSTLKAMQASPLHYHHRLTTPRADTPAMRFGRACHTAVLEPDAFPLEWTLYAGRRAGKAWEEFAAVNADKGILTVDEYDACLGVRDAVHDHPDAAKLLRGCKFETTVEWTDSGTGIKCKCRPDAVKKRTVIDFKTTPVLGDRWIRYTVRDLAYLGQLAFYAEGLAVTSGVSTSAYEAFLIGAETKPPYDVGAFPIDPDLLFDAGVKAHGLLDELAECQRTGHWYGRYPRLHTITPLPWEIDDGKDEIRILEGLAPHMEVAR